MSLLGHGVDIVLLSRIQDVWQRHGDAFLTRVYTIAEREYCLPSKVALQRLSGRWAAKEAVLKALGTGWRGGIEFTDIEILPDRLGRPMVTLSGRTREIAAERGVIEFQVSISHGGEYAVATAIALGERPEKPETGENGGKRR